MAKWITIEGREHPLLIHGTYDLEVGDRVTVFPLKGDKISAATAKGLPIEPGARVVVVPHERYPGSQIYRSIFGNDEMAPHIHIGNIGEYQIIFVDEYADFHAEITSNPPLQSQTWNFGDWQSGSLNTSWDANPSHQYRHPGWYNVRLTARNQHLSDTVTWESAVRVEVPPPTSLSASNVGSGRVRVSWTPGIPNESCKVMVRTDMYPPHPNNGTIIYWGQATSLELNLTPGTRYYFRVWGIYEGVLSEGYHSFACNVIGDVGGETSDSVLISSEWLRSVKYIYEEISYGPIAWNWGGLGRVYISSTIGALGSFWVDDYIDVSTEYGTISKLSGHIGNYIPALDITSIMRPGLNQVEITVRDEFGGGIGVSKIYLTYIP